MQNPDRGVVYVATGDKYYSEAILSAASVKRHNPDLSITIMTDEERGAPCFDRHLIIATPCFHPGDKPLNIHRTPYQSTLFLDSDTFATGDISEYFSILDRFDFAAVHEVARGEWYFPEYEKHGIPGSFSEVNSGVFSFRRNAATEKLLRDWADYYVEETSPGGWLCSKSRHWERTNDQTSLRRALWKNAEVNLCVLPTEFNALRFWGTYLWGRARVVHGRGNIGTVASEMNEFPNIERVYLQQFGMIPCMDRIPLSANLRICLRFSVAGLFVLGRRIKAKIRASLDHRLHD